MDREAEVRALLANECKMLVTLQEQLESMQYDITRLERESHHHGSSDDD